MSPADKPSDLLALAENDYQAALILARAQSDGLLLLSYISSFLTL